MGKNFKMLAKTLYGLEDLLAEELRKLGASHIEKALEMSPSRAILDFCIKPICAVGQRLRF